MEKSTYKEIFIGKSSNQRTVIISSEDKTILEGRVYFDIHGNRPVVQINKGKRFSKTRNFQLGTVVVSKHYMSDNGIPIRTLDDVLNWMITGDNYSKFIGETHHRFNAFDNRIEALQAVITAEHKSYRQSDFNMEAFDLDDYIRQTRTHCCDCTDSSFMKLGKENSFPQCCQKCDYWHCRRKSD